MEATRRRPLTTLAGAAVLFLAALAAVFGIVAGVLTLLWLWIESWWDLGARW